MAKKNRRKKTIARMDAIHEFAERTHAKFGAVSIRQCYYQLVTLGLVEKEEKCYRATSRLMTEMREDGDLPWRWVDDSTRGVDYVGFNPDYHARREDSNRNNIVNSLRPAIQYGGWHGQKNHVQVWCEKEGMANIFKNTILDVGGSGVAYVSTGGTPSVSLINNVASDLAMHMREKRKVYLFYFGDFDPKGWDIFHSDGGLKADDEDTGGIAKKLPMYVERHLREANVTDIDVRANLHMEWMAVEHRHIEEHALRTRTQTKKLKPSQKKRFPYPYSVEIDAIPVAVLTDILRGCIQRTIDVDAQKENEKKNRAEYAKLKPIKSRIHDALDVIEQEGEFDFGEDDRWLEGGIR